MAVKPVLNLKSFSIGHTSAMASFVMPTTELVQDVRDYDSIGDFGIGSGVEGISVEENAPCVGVRNLLGEIEEFVNGRVKERNAVHAVLKYVKELDESLFSVLANAGERGRFLKKYEREYRIFRHCAWVKDRVVECRLAVERALERGGASSDESDASVKATLLSILSESYPYQVHATDKGSLFLSEVSNYVASLTASESILSDTFLTSLIGTLQSFVDLFEVGGEEDVLPSSSEYSGFFGDCQKGVNDTEQPLPPFFYILRTFVAINDLVFLDADESAIKSVRREFLRWFDNLRMLYNRRFVERYKGAAVEFPYFLDLGFKESTQGGEVTDVNGALMHSLEREVSDGDSWESNYTKGDKFRIRDMFRVDKLNKKSAYESSALYPGMTGNRLDASLEKEDVVTRLAQDASDFFGVVGTAATSDGMYVVTQQNDAIPAVVRSTTFGDAAEVLDTNTFRTYAREVGDVDYLQSKSVPSTVNFVRAFGGKSREYSSGSDFLEWFNNFHRSVRIVLSATYGEGSLLKVVGSGCYEFYPTNDGMRTIEGAYDPSEDASLTDDEFTRALPSAGFIVKASLGDSNYKEGVKRKLNIEVPCNMDSQYSYISFDVGFFLDSFLDTPFNKSKDVSLELSIDDELPVRYYFRGTNGGNPENLTTGSSLYYSLYDIELDQAKSVVPSINSMGRITLKIENDLLTGKSKMLRIGTASNFSSLFAGASDEMVRASRNTFVAVANPTITIGGMSQDAFVTYGNYTEYKASRSESFSDFWNLSRSIHSAPHQYLLEVPTSISINATKRLYSNYQTADLFSDVLTLKNPSDSEYNMRVERTTGAFSMDRFREYTGIDACSETVALYYDADQKHESVLFKDNADEHQAQEYEVKSTTESTHPHSSKLRFKRIETIKSINRFNESIKHKSNLFSVIISNSGADEAIRKAEYETALASPSEKEAARERELKVREDVETMKKVIEMMTRNICNEYAPAHNQLFKVYFE